MKTFKEYISESLDSSVKWKWVRGYKDLKVNGSGYAEFKINDLEYIVQFTEWGNYKRILNRIFKESKELESKYKKDNNDPRFKTWEIDFELSNVKDIKTRKKDPFTSMELMQFNDINITLKVFATVGKILDDFLKKMHYPIFSFSAREVSRKKLYDRFAKTLSDRYGYKLITTGGLRSWLKEYIFYKE